MYKKRPQQRVSMHKFLQCTNFYFLCSLWVILALIRSFWTAKFWSLPNYAHTWRNNDSVELRYCMDCNVLVSYFSVCVCVCVCVCDCAKWHKNVAYTIKASLQNKNVRDFWYFYFLSSVYHALPPPLYYALSRDFITCYWNPVKVASNEITNITTVYNKFLETTPKLVCGECVVCIYLFIYFYIFFLAWSEPQLQSPSRKIAPPPVSRWSRPWLWVESIWKWFWRWFETRRTWAKSRQGRRYDRWSTERTTQWWGRRRSPDGGRPRAASRNGSRRRYDSSVRATVPQSRHRDGRPAEFFLVWTATAIAAFAKSSLGTWYSWTWTPSSPTAHPRCWQSTSSAIERPSWHSNELTRFRATTCT